MMPELNLLERVIALEGVDLMSGLEPDQMASIALIATEVRYPPGRVVLEEGKPADAFYVVIDGSVQLTRGPESLETAGANTVLGVWALWDQDELAPFGATAREDSRLLRIGREEFYDLLADNSDITAAILSKLMKRFEKLVGQ
jgi:CRP-like cAMP-binding protein